MERQRLIHTITSSIGQVRLGHPVRVAIDGVDAAGKTTFAGELAEAMGDLGREVIRSSIDGFHRPAAERHRRGGLSPEGYYRDSFDHEALIETLLRPLGPGGSGVYRRAHFDFRSDRPVDSQRERADPDAVLLFDGVFLHRPALRDHFDWSIFVRADFAVTIGRAEMRDRDLFGGVDEVRRRYEHRYVPGQQIYLSEVRPERLATVVIDNDDPLHPVVVRWRGIGEPE